jgi:hypothetical protein
MDALRDQVQALASRVQDLEGPTSTLPSVGQPQDEAPVLEKIAGRGGA